jgi:DNA-directed RNA polymerase specialized sigma24 family protein
VQEAAFKAWRKLSRLREGSDMRPWFLGIVANECRPVMRSRWWSVVRSGGPEVRAESPDETAIANVELRQALRCGVQKLRRVRSRTSAPSLMRLVVAAGTGVAENRVATHVATQAVSGDT